MKTYLASLRPGLPRSVQTLQAGGLVNAFGNGVVLPFTFIYLHNVRGFGLGTVGLILATNAAVSLVAGPVAGSHFLLAFTPTGLWLVAAGLCLAAGFASLALEPRLPAAARRTPVAAGAKA